MTARIPSDEVFARASTVVQDAGVIALHGDLPGEKASKGEIAHALVTAKDREHQRQIELLKKLAEGGEGAVFTTSIKGFVAKIYKRDRLTHGRKNKLMLMISKPIACDGVCFPEALILNRSGEFVGYLMREAKGYELGKSIFQPKLLERKFPNWKKKDSIELCLTILEKIQHLNSRNIILGDINPANILVVSSKEVYFVDCDSYQVEGYPCPVGTANYTPPEIQGKDYKTFLRTQAMENFAIATLLFMIMLPGKAPYSAVGGESPEKNIKNGVFPYLLTEDTDKTPPGKWGFIWSNMSYKTKEAFYNTFAKDGKYFKPDRRLNSMGWTNVFKMYEHSLSQMITNDPMANEVFPTRLKGDYVVEYRTCKSCGKKFPITKRHADWEQRKSRDEGQEVRVEICDDCKKNRNNSRGSAPVSGSVLRQSSMKLCPYCHQRKIYINQKYCKECGEKVVEQRECANCHRKFPATVSLKEWERTHYAKRRQCDTCRAAHCTADPCIHAPEELRRKATLDSSGKRTSATDAQKSAKPIRRAKSKGSGSSLEQKIWDSLVAFFAVFLVVYFFVVFVGAFGVGDAAPVIAPHIGLLAGICAAVGYWKNS